jgi:phosphoglycolate phosphatase
LKLLLFDLDGTLVSTGGAGLRALDRAFEKLHRLPKAMKGVTPAGKTDPLIVREVFEKKLERRATDAEVAEACEAYLSFLAEEMRTAAAQGYRVIEGVRDLLEDLRGRPDLLLALGTGNLERGARIKLEPSGLNMYFPFGGFGSDAEVRADVLRAGHRRAEARAGRAIPPTDVYVIGDTILDVQAGKAIGAVTVAVACGHGKCDELKAAQPDIYLEDFRDARELLTVL